MRGAARFARCARAARARGGMGGSRDGGGGPRNPSPPSPEAPSDPSGAFFDLFCRVWGVVVGTSTRQKCSLEIQEGPFSVPGTF